MPWLTLKIHYRSITNTWRRILGSAALYMMEPHLAPEQRDRQCGVSVAWSTTKPSFFFLKLLTAQPSYLLSGVAGDLFYFSIFKILMWNVHRQMNDFDIRSRTLCWWIIHTLRIHCCTAAVHSSNVLLSRSYVLIHNFFIDRNWKSVTWWYGRAKRRFIPILKMWFISRHKTKIESHIHEEMSVVYDIIMYDQKLRSIKEKNKHNKQTWMTSSQNRERGGKPTALWQVAK